MCLTHSDFIGSNILFADHLFTRALEGMNGIAVGSQFSFKCLVLLNFPL